jgi:hypothetical protein
MLAALLALAVLPPTLVKAADSTSPGHPCASVVDNLERLACYDRAFGRPVGAAPATSASMATTAPAPATPTTMAAAATAPAAPAPTAAVPAVDPAVKAREEFGLNQTHKRAIAASEGTPAPDSITKTVASVTRTPAGESVVHLDGGQVWMEVAAYTGVSIKPGDVVTIRKASLGSFMLVTPRHAATRVRRLE